MLWNYLIAFALIFVAIDALVLVRLPIRAHRTNHAFFYEATDIRIRSCFFPMTIRASQRFLSSQSSEKKDGDEDDYVDYSSEETLLCVDFELQPGVEINEAFTKVSKFCQSFPFAAVLPVQPLHYVPVYEDGGVEVRFLRKKTATKGNLDGGIRFFLRVAEDSDSNDDNGTPATIQVTAKRNSQGQTIAKVMSEKLVVTNFVAAITGNQTRFGDYPSDHVQMKSLYHKWM